MLNNDFTRVTHWANSLGVLAILLLSLCCCGCFSDRAELYCEKYKDRTNILEKRGELAPDGKNFTVHLRKRMDYRRISFGEFDGSVEQSVSHEYSLTRPEPDAKRLVLKLDPSAENRCRMFQVNKSGWHFVKEVDYSLLDLPFIECNSYSMELYENYPKIKESSEQLLIRIHPDDIPLLMKPFLFKLGFYHRSLAIPYKMDGNLCHFYIPKEDLATEYDKSTPNGSQTVMRIILMPPAIVLDILTSPVQICIIVSDIYKFMTGRMELRK